MQFISAKREPVEVNPVADFQPENATDLMNILHKACYDCHSYETKYPWYAGIAPVSFFLNNHIEEGREHLNFSEWNTYPIKDQQHIAEEIVEVVKEKEMPMLSYWLVHWDAKLTDAERAVITSYFGGATGDHAEEEDDD